MPDASSGAPSVYLDAEIRPHRSLSRSGFIALMTAVGGVSFVAGVFYVAIGAWPIMGFLGLDALLVWVAFRLSYRQARLVERVRVTAEAIDVERIAPSGARASWRLPAYWTRVMIDEPVEHASRLELAASGQRIIVGAFLAPKERARFAATLRAALAAAKEERWS